MTTPKHAAATPPLERTTDAGREGPLPPERAPPRPAGHVLLALTTRAATVAENPRGQSWRN
ncbi:MAG: hypothetical protein NTY19_43070 [Planctomycetota bacterium]|nr:hypothetical protein [Planctomycetota bacterium]